MHTAPNGSRPTTLIVLCAAVALVGTFQAQSTDSTDSTAPRATQSPRPIHAHSRSPEPVEIDYDDTGEAIEYSAALGTRESMESYLARTSAAEHLWAAVVDCAYNEYANNPDFTPEDAIVFCLE